MENGASATLTNVVSGTTTGTLSLTQAAYGGNGGATDGASAGIGGNASSSFVLTQNGVTQLTADISAIGGLGGSTQNNNGGAGGLLDGVRYSHGQRACQRYGRCGK